MINGLTYIDDFISEEESKLLLGVIDSHPWQTSLKRRVQQYGPVYDYTTKSLKEKYFPIPEFIKSTISKIDELNLFQTQPNQIIINEYLSGQGIAKHIDSAYFGSTVASLSLCSSTIMLLGQYGGEEFNQELKTNSIIVLAGEARTKWYHSIPTVSERRVSVTFRTVDNIE